ncbi:MAG: glycoside hydrolase family 25 protein [Lachnospiraceae bacterium]|nr:glycoside hydrolase family 25 protein [Lachnospiraceae bacterium]
MDLHDVEFEEVEIESKPAGEPAPQGEYEAVRTAGPKPNKVLFIASVILLLISITLFGITYLVYVKEAFKQPEPEPEPVITYTREELDSAVSKAAADARTETEERVDQEYKDKIYEAAQIAGGTGNYLRYLFPNYIILTDGNKFTFQPLNRDIKLSKVESSLFKKDEETGLLHYTDVNGEVTSHVGIDVSTFQKQVDWQKVKDAGVEFAIIRCAFRGYGSEGRLVVDNMFESHMKGAQSVGLNIGVYFYTQATTVAEAKEEADMALELIKPYNINGPIVIDVEETTADTPRTYFLSPEERTDCVAAFCERVKEAGYKPMIYANIKFFILKLDIARLDDYPKWYASYNDLYDASKIESIWAFNDPLYFPYEFDMWQYSDTGRIDGIKGNVDLNILFEKWW